MCAGWRSGFAASVEPLVNGPDGPGVGAGKVDPIIDARDIQRGLCHPYRQQKSSMQARDPVDHPASWLHGTKSSTT